MQPPVAALALAGALAVGCGTLAGLPPAPPLAAPANGAPKDFTLTPIKWRPGLVLTYQVQSSFEAQPGGTDHGHEVIQMKGADRSAKGAARVHVLVDSQDLGSLLIDAVGYMQDAVAATPESAAGLADLAETIQVSLVRRLRPKSFAVGDTFTWELPATSLRRLLPRNWGAALPARLPVRGEFVGYVRLGDALAAAVRFDTPNLLHAPIRARDRDNRELRIDVLVAEGVEYFAATAGYSLAKYEVLTGGGVLGRQRYAVRAVRVTTLDRGRSSGLPDAGPPLPVSRPRVPKPKDETASVTAVYELTREDLPAAERIRSTSLAVFGIQLGSSYEDLLRAVAGIGRPSSEIPLGGASRKAVTVYAGEEEAKAGHRMALFLARDNVIEEIHLHGTDRAVSTSDSPAYRGFDSIAVGRTRALLTECMSTARMSILGDQDRATTTEFPGGQGGFLRRYEYDRAGLELSHLRRGRETASPADHPALYEQCLLRLRYPASPQ